MWIFSNSGKWSGFYHKQHRALALFTVASLFGDQIPGFNLTLRSRDNMQIWWRHIRRNKPVETNKQIWAKVLGCPRSKWVITPQYTRFIGRFNPFANNLLTSTDTQVYCRNPSSLILSFKWSPGFFHSQLTIRALRHSKPVRCIRYCLPDMGIFHVFLDS